MQRADDEFVAAEFSVDPQLARQPPDGWVVEEQRLDQPLDQVHPQVASADVSEFVCDDRFDHVGFQFGDPRDGQQDHRLEESNCDRLGHAVAQMNERPRHS